MGSIIKYINAFLCISVFIIFTVYVFLNAQLKDNYGDTVLLLLAFLSLPRLKSIDFANFRFFLINLSWCFLALTLSSVLFPPSQYANINWLVHSIFRLSCSAIIVLSHLRIGDVERLVLKWGICFICLVLSISYIAEHCGVSIQGIAKEFTPFKIVPVNIYIQHNNAVLWHVKNYAFWQLLLMWGSVSLLWRTSLAGSIFSHFVIASSVAAIFFSSSESAKLTVVLSGIVFFFSHFLKQGRGYILYVSSMMGVLIFPLLWVVLAPVKNFSSSLVSNIHSIFVRMEIFDYTALLVRKELILGYGFGSTLFMPLPEGAVSVGNQPDKWWLVFPGGHPHNLTFLFLVDHGLLGMIFLIFVSFLLFHHVYYATKGNVSAPAVWALILSGLILFSLSHSIWKADVVLMYCMWISLVFIAASDAKVDGNKLPFSPYVNILLIMFGLLCIVFYSADYFILSRL